MATLDPEFDRRIRALLSAAQAQGYNPQVASGYRSPQDQARAIDSVSRNVQGRPASVVDFARGIRGYAAPVGGSKHQQGLAADLTDSGVDWARQNASAYGVSFPQGLRGTDPNHAEIDPNFWGPVQDPRDRAGPVAEIPKSKGGFPAPMGLGGPPRSQDAEAQPGGFYGQMQPTSSGAATAQPVAPITTGSTGAAPMGLGMGDTPQQGQGGFDLNNWFTSPLFLMGASVLGSQNLGQGLSQGAQTAASIAAGRRKEAKDAELFPLQKQLLAAQVTKANEPPTTDDIREFQFAVKEAERLGLPAPRFDAHMEKKRDKGFGLNPIMGIGPDGKPAAMFAKNGELFPGKVQPGYTIDPRNVTKIDTGTGTQIVGNSGNVIANVNKDIAGAETQKVVGKDTGEKIANLPRLKQSYDSYDAQVTSVTGDIDKAISSVGKGWSTGLTGSVASKLPGTPQYDLKAVLGRIKANLGFDKLADIRAQSPTGGALGNVTEKELEFLQSVEGSLDQAQSAGQLSANLKTIKKRMEEFRQQRLKALEEDTRRYGGAVVGPPNMQTKADPQGFTDAGNGIKIRRLD